MKNISRRVFIKGMAVAAAATAASTVLAGCNVVPGKDEPVIDNTVKGETKTLTLGDETVEVTLVSYGYTMTGALQAKVQVVNKTDDTVTIYSNLNASETDNRVLVAAYFDGNYSSKMVVDGINNTAVPANDEGKSYVMEKTISIAKNALPKEWEKAELVFTLCLKDEDGKLQKTQVSFTVNK